MAVLVDVAAAFQDPESDTLTYGATTSLTSVATVSRSGSMLTITPGTSGRTIITVTATDAGGSNMSASQRFRVTVGHDYDSDGDGLIGVSSLAQLDAMRYDLDGMATRAPWRRMRRPSPRRSIVRLRRGGLLGV